MTKTLTEILIELTDRIEPLHRTARATIEGLIVNVRVMDARIVWQKPQVLITPLNGEGEKWIDAGRLLKRLL